ncbi:hypothetical protein BC835DRAFT_1422996 [Cytidiella melzeri]|nr:hypothetical protein BC835DRAFT_1422996 [Cytidiella melzeri]
MRYSAIVTLSIIFATAFPTIAAPHRRALTEEQLSHFKSLQAQSAIDSAKDPEFMARRARRMAMVIAALGVVYWVHSRLSGKHGRNGKTMPGKNMPGRHSSKSSQRREESTESAAEFLTLSNSDDILHSRENLNEMLTRSLYFEDDRGINTLD